MFKHFFPRSPVAAAVIFVIIAGVCIYVVKRPTSVNTENSLGRKTKIFRSQQLGVSFSYPSQDLGQEILVEEVGSTIYVHPANLKREQGQYVQVFQKSSQVTLAQAVQQQFLSSGQSPLCQTKNGTDENGVQPTSGVAAIISFPLGTDANTDGLEFRKNCSEQYSLTNGLSYFWTDSERSTKFVFFSIGQYTIPVSVTGASWHTTLEFID